MGISFGSGEKSQTLQIRRWPLIILKCVSNIIKLFLPRLLMMVYIRTESGTKTRSKKDEDEAQPNHNADDNYCYYVAGESLRLLPAFGAVCWPVKGSHSPAEEACPNLFNRNQTHYGTHPKKIKVRPDKMQPHPQHGDGLRWDNKTRDENDRHFLCRVVWFIDSLC